MMVVVMVTMVMFFAALKFVLSLKLQTSEINSYRGGISIAFGNRTSLVMVVVVVVPVMIMMMMTEMLFAVLQLVLGLSNYKRQESIRTAVESVSSAVTLLCNWC
jgi:hypothetical protein